MRARGLHSGQTSGFDLLNQLSLEGRFELSSIFSHFIYSGPRTPQDR